MVRKKQKIIQDIPAFSFMLILWRVLPVETAALFVGSSARSFAMGTIVILSMLMFLWHLFVHLYKKLPDRGALLVPLVGLIVLGLSVLVHANEWNMLYLTYYVMYVFFTLIFLLNVQNYQYLVALFSKFALVTFLLLGWQPMASTNVFENWMQYGFTVALPCTIGLYTLAREKNNVLYWSLTVASFFLAIAFANRSTWLGIMIFVVLYELVLEKGTFSKLRFIVLALIAVLLVACYFETILNWLLDFSSISSYDSHSLKKIRLLLDGTTMNIFMSGRQELSNLAIKEIVINFPFGSGIGHFEAMAGVYSHNIALDMLLYWGALGAIFVFVALFCIFKSMIKEGNYAIKTFKIIMICLWFPKLLFSGTFTYDIAFWSGLTLMGAAPVIMHSE